MADTRKPLDKERVFYFADTLAAGQAMYAKQGATTDGVISCAGQRRIKGNVSTSQTPASGFPRLRFSMDGVNFDLIVPLTKDSSQSGNQYPFDVECFLPYATLELTNGAGGVATVRAYAELSPEGSGATSTGPSPPTPGSGLPATYRATFSVAAAGAGQFLMLENPAGSGKVLRVTEQLLSKPTATLGWSTVKQSSPTTLGTPVATPGVSLDSADPATPTGVVTAYTTVPTPGTAVGTVWRLPSVTAVDTFIDTPGSDGLQKSIVLRAGESIALVTTAAATIVGLLEWTESDT